MDSNQLRQKFLDFFAKKGHKIIPSASLIPENDPTVLFNTAGMQPLVPYFLGEKHPAGKRLADAQKCLRTVDIDEVGDNWHLTFFEMLGNWSLGDPASPDGIGQGGYFKKEAIEMSFEFLTKELNLPLDRLAFTCFEGEPENNIPKDTESFEIWQSLGVSPKRIKFLGRDDNWWGPAGQTGPCGPDTEMFYWASDQPAPEEFDPENKNWVEFWNDVFMEYNKTADGKYEKLQQKNVDTGMGLERTAAVLNGFNSVYQLDTVKPILEKIEGLSGKKYIFEKGDLGLEEKPECWEQDVKSMRIIADHLRTATFILGDQKGIEPSNLDQGYVLRKLIRRAIRHGRMIGITEKFTSKIAEVVVGLYKEAYSELTENKDFIFNQLDKEEEKFLNTLEKGLKEFEKLAGSNISGHDAFILFSSYGFPLEMTQELAAEKRLKVDTKGFEEEFTKHQELSRTASEGKFKGGLADHSEISTKYHTATHLLLAALRQVLGDHVYQKGSNITAERLRFDFSHPEKLTPEQLEQVQTIVNEKIKEALPVKAEVMGLDQAKKMGAMGVFDHKYTDQVKVYTIGDFNHLFSRELCGGPHVENTSQLGHFKIIKEEASSSGVRRIKAILE
ncbi:MAG: alanine--tRNA ligase [Candidatus Buchananbacteria bacterium]|nr:alanine--tRNA ligase [Candidatus Buchananbacteria bacterium]